MDVTSGEWVAAAAVQPRCVPGASEKLMGALTFRLRVPEVTSLALPLLPWGRGSEDQALDPPPQPPHTVCSFLAHVWRPPRPDLNVRPGFPPIRTRRHSAPSFRALGVGEHPFPRHCPPNPSTLHVNASPGTSLTGSIIPVFDP